MRRRLPVATRVAATALLLAAAAGPVARAEEAPRDGSFAGHPAAWWVSRLGEEATRAVAREALLVIGAPARRAVVEGLAHPSPAAREAAAAVLERIPGSAPDLLPLLDAPIRHPDPVVATAAMRLAARSGEEAGTLVPAIASRLRDAADVRDAALEALRAAGAAGEDAIVSDLLALDRSDAEQRARAFASLEWVGPRSVAHLASIADLVPGTDEQHRTLVRAAVRIDSRSPYALAVLEKALASGVATVVAAAVDGFAQRAADDADEVVRFQDLLGSADAAGFAVAAAARTPSLAARSIPGLLRAARSPDTAVSGRATEVLVRLPAGDVDDHVEALLSVLPPPRRESFVDAARPETLARAAEAYARFVPSIRFSLARAFAQRDGSEWGKRGSGIADALLRDVASEDVPPPHRHAAAGALGRLAAADPAAVPLLVETLRHSDYAAGALASLPHARPGVLDALESPDAVLRGRALDVLLQGSLSSVEADVVGRLLADADPEVRRRAAFAVMRVDGAFGRGRDERAWTARFELSALLRELEAACTHERSPERRTAARCLGALGALAEPSVPALVRALGDPEAPVAFAAADALVRIGQGGGPSPVAAVAPARASADPLSRAGAARVLAAAADGVPDAVRLLGPLLDDADPKVRARALEVVSVLGADAGVHAARVAALREDPDGAVRSRAVAAMEALKRPK